MGKCKYCGQDAGFFRSKHDECEKKHRQGLAAIKQIISSCFVLKEDFYLKDREIKQIAQTSFIDSATLNHEMCSAFDEAIELSLIHI